MFERIGKTLCRLGLHKWAVLPKLRHPGYYEKCWRCNVVKGGATTKEERQVEIDSQEYPDD